MFINSLFMDTSEVENLVLKKVSTVFKNNKWQHLITNFDTASLCFRCTRIVFFPPDFESGM